ncbi:hypothetical protein RCH14_004435 [Massilia sp. MP_M2]
MVRLLVLVSIRAAMSVAYGEEAAEHYRESYTAAYGLHDWMLGFREGWQATTA